MTSNKNKEYVMKTSRRSKPKLTKQIPDKANSGPLQEKSADHWSRLSEL